MPKPNLYQSLHTTIIAGKKHTVEIQIRTHDMHNLAENGIAAHWKYKETDTRHIMKEDKRLNWLREMVDLYKEQKSPREFLKSLKTDLIPEEVYVFTPKGKVVTLPLGTSALDFAFKIHSEIGLHCAGAKINARIEPLKTILKTGDIVEILTSPEKTPSRDWLNIAFTSTARHNIKRWLNLQDKIRNTTLGKKLWEKEIKNYKVSADFLKEENLLKSLSSVANVRLKKMENFYAHVGFGKIVLEKKFMEKLLPAEKIEKKKDTFFKKVVTKVAKKPKPVIQAKGVHLAKCCSPIMGEPIIGYITSGKGITVHSLRCPLVEREVLDNQRMVEVSWDDTPKGLFKGKLLIKAEDSPGVLAKLAFAISRSDGNITKAEVTTSEDKKAQIKLILIIRNIKHLEAMMKKLSAIKEISSVERI
jgi:GTP pyrophosphokinase